MIRLSAIAAIACSLSLATLAAPKAQEQPQAEGCPRLVSSTQPRILPAVVNVDELALTFIGHATFLIETPAGLTVATDYNDYVKPSILPNVITMNRAHSTHYTNHPDAGIKHVLRGWDVSGGPATHDVTIGDMRIRNVVTNIRDWQGGTDYAGNSIFVFEASQLCIAHLGHLHHELTDEHIKQLGRIDVALVPVDGSYTLSTAQMFKVVQQISPQLVIPMHFFSQSTLRRFLDIAREHYPVEMSQTPSIVLSRQMLPIRTKVLVLPGR
jgi:L-ascorbate metabolism protein UlaG (beta-lactamase superfamily)